MPVHQRYLGRTAYKRLDQTVPDPSCHSLMGSFRRVETVCGRQGLNWPVLQIHDAARLPVSEPRPANDAKFALTMSLQMLDRSPLAIP